ncbi:MAG: hypothetical protein ACOCY6_04450 [Halodesulfurarchaeum sp.]
MERSRSLRWAGRYFLYTTGLAILGLAFVAVGGYLLYTGLLLGPERIAGVPYPHLSTQSYVGLVPLILGVAIWRFGKAWALYHTLTGAVREELGEEYDTEHVKSDIATLLDDRLSDMQQDIQSINRELRSIKGAAEFEFSKDD